MNNTKKIFMTFVLLIIILVIGFLSSQIINFASLRYPAHPLTVTLNEVVTDAVDLTESFYSDYGLSLSARKRIEKNPDMYRVIYFDCTLKNETDFTLHAWRCTDLSFEDAEPDKVFINKKPFEILSETIKPGETRDVFFSAIISADALSEKGLYDVSLSAKAVKIK